MGAWEKMLCHSGHDEVVIWNPAMPAIRLVTRSFMRRVEPWRRMVIALARHSWSEAVSEGGSQFLCEAIPVPVKAARANSPQYDPSQVAPQGYTGENLENWGNNSF